MHIPLDRIDATALMRDRTVLDRAAMDELKGSILQNGLRQPIEVFETPQGYGLLSGYRRLAAMRELHAAGLDRFAEIEAVLRSPADRAAALAAMVEENDIRAELSPWERGAIAAGARRAGVFDTLDTALAGLYPQASRQKRAKLRAVAEVVEALDGPLTDPEDLSENRLLRLSALLRLGWAELIEAALTGGERTAEAEWARLRPLLDEAEGLRRRGASTHPNRPRRLSRPRPGLVIRRERTPHGYSLHLTGTRATGTLVRDALDRLEFWLGEG